MVMTKAPQSQMQVIDGDYEGDEGLVPVSSAAIEIASTREAQEVQAQMTIAKRFPRNETDAYARVLHACKRKGLAARAQYKYSRGGSTITGPTIRLAETLARCWGNLNFGITEIERARGKSLVQAFAWDLETNTRQTKTFTVRHERHTREGVTILTDERDIYELIANNGARRMRNCILGVIPGDIVDDAIEQCAKTLAAANAGVPLSDRVRKLAAWFSEKGITIAVLEAKLQHSIDATTEMEYADLQGLATAITEKVVSIEDAFKNARADVAAAKSPTAADAQPKKKATEKLKEALKGEQPKPETPPTAPKRSTDQVHTADSDPPPASTYSERDVPLREPGSDDGDDDLADQPITG